MHLDAESIRFAVEYERTLKSQVKYEKIREAIESEKRIQGFLCLVPTLAPLWALADEFRGTKRLILVGLMDEFKRKVFDADVWGPNYHTTSLKQALRKVAALEKIKVQGPAADAPHAEEPYPLQGKQRDRRSSPLGSSSPKHDYGDRMLRAFIK